MLPAAFRLRQRPDFNATVRLGRRAARQRLVVHLRIPVTTETPAPGDASIAPPARAGFVIGRTVGGAVVRNRVRRQLRHLTAARLGQLPTGSTLVVRALPAAAGSTSGELARDLDAGVARCLGAAR